MTDHSWSEAGSWGLVLVASVAAHAVAGLALAALPHTVDVGESIVAEVELPIELVVPPPPHVPEPSPPPLPEPPPPPVRIEPRVRVEPEVVEAEPEVVEEAPAEELASADIAESATTDIPTEGPALPIGDGLSRAPVTGRAGGARAGEGARVVRAASPPGPSDEQIRRARRAYVASLESLLRSRTRYPRVAQRARHEGRVELVLRVARSGRLLGVRVASSSGFGELDDAALSAARELEPPAPPSIVPWRGAEDVRAPVVYVLR